MESSERSTTEDNLCDSLNGCINLTKSSNDVTTPKIRQKRPDREFYVPPNAHMSKVKSPVAVSKTSCKKPSKLVKPNQRKPNSSKLKKTDDTSPVDVQDKSIHNTEDVCKNSLNKAEKTEQKENQSMAKLGPTKEQMAKVTTNSSESEPSWEDIYDDDGDCVEPQIVEKFCDNNDEKRDKHNLRVSDSNHKRDLNYLSDDHESCDPDDSKLSHVLEIYDFPNDLKTQDLVTSLSVFNSRNFDIKWVDDTHALAVFSSQAAAREAMSMPYNNIRLRPLSEAIKESKVKAQKCAEYLLPYKQRPQTSAILARRLVTGALGIRSNISSEQRAAEKKRLQEAKEKRRLAMKLTQDAWEGNVG